jgi:hypothetical protein
MRETGTNLEMSNGRALPTGTVIDVERRAWQLASAAFAPDEEVAMALEQAATPPASEAVTAAPPPPTSVPRGSRL